jgi:hypothetical protein
MACEDGRDGYVMGRYSVCVGQILVSFYSSSLLNTPFYVKGVFMESL